MSSRDNLLNDKKSCSFEENDVENVCCTYTDSACGDGVSTIQGKYLEILCFRHFDRLLTFSQSDRKTYKKAIFDGVNVSVVLDMES